MVAPEFEVQPEGGRVELQRTPVLPDRLVPAGERVKARGVVASGVHGAGIELDCPAELRLPGGPVPLREERDVAGGVVNLGEGIVQGPGSLHRSQGPGAEREIPDEGVHGIGLEQKGVRQRELWVPDRRLFEVGRRLAELPAVEEVPPVGIGLVRRRLGRWVSDSWTGAELDPKIGGDGLRNLALQRHDVRGLALERAGPQMSVGRRPDELRGDPYPSARPQDRAFDHRIHPELPRDLGQGLRRALVAHRRGARYDLPCLDVSQLGNQLLRHPVGEVLLGRVAGEVRQGQDGNGPDNGRPRGSRQPTAHEPGSRQGDQRREQSSSRQDDPAPPGAWSGGRRCLHRRWRYGRGGGRRCFCSRSRDRGLPRHGHENAIAPPADRADGLRVSRRLPQRSPQLDDTPRQRIVGDERVRPELLVDLVLRHHTPFPPGEADEKIHRFRRDLTGLAVANQRIQLGLDQPRPQEEVHGRRSARYYTTVHSEAARRQGAFHPARGTARKSVGRMSEVRRDRHPVRLKTPT